MPSTLRHFFFRYLPLFPFGMNSGIAHRATRGAAVMETAVAWATAAGQAASQPASQPASHARAAPEEGPRAWRIAYRGERESGRLAREWRGPGLWTTAASPAAPPSSPRRAAGGARRAAVNRVTRDPTSIFY
eukprot:COSAG06_NODE_808_length_12164_cov_76.683382_6_plen_132_part_00